MMRNLYWKELQPGILKRLLLPLFALLVLGAEGCGSGDGGGDNITQQTLPVGTDYTLDLKCENEGIYTETCVLDDPRNPFKTINIVEFDMNDPEASNKFELADEIPGGPEGAKSRFYFWATALARRSSGENQFFTAVALHDLYTAGVNAGFGSPNAQNQAIKAYRAVLDYYFGSVTFLNTCDFLFPSPPQPELFYSIILSDSAGVNLVDPPGPITFRDCDGNVNAVEGLVTLFPDDNPVVSDFTAREALGEWGYSYIEVDADTVFVTVSNFL